MWLADSWKDYEVLDTSAGESSNGGGNTSSCARIRR